MAKYPPRTTSTARSTSPYRQFRTVSTTCHCNPLEAEAIMNPPSPAWLLLRLYSCAAAAPAAGDGQQYGLGVMRVARLNRGGGKLDIMAILDMCRVVWSCAGAFLCALTGTVPARNIVLESFLRHPTNLWPWPHRRPSVCYPSVLLKL